MTAQVASASGRLRSIDALRGAAALAVVLFHAINYRPDVPVTSTWMAVVYTVLNHGNLGVALFFVISGFCIHLRWAREYRRRGGPVAVGFSDFWKRRLHRLYPPYFVALCGSMLLVVVAAVMGSNVALLHAYPEPRLRSIGLDFLAHALMLHGFSPRLDVLGGNPAYWSLAREEYLYALYFFLLAWRSRYGTLRSTLLVLGIGVGFSAAAQILLSPASPWLGLARTSAIALWIQWCLGMVAVEAYFGLIELPRLFHARWMIPVWAAAAALADARAQPLAPVLWGMAFFTLLNSVTRLECTRGWRSSRWADWLADVGLFSYSLYLVHLPIRIVLRQALGPLADTANPALYMGIAALMTVGGYLGGKLFFLAVERRFLAAAPSRPAARAQTPSGALLLPGSEP